MSVRRRPHENEVLMVSIDQPQNAWIQVHFSNAHITDDHTTHSSKKFTRVFSPTD
jgi:hypothetical protein